MCIEDGEDKRCLPLPVSSEFLGKAKHFYQVAPVQDLSRSGNMRIENAEERNPFMTPIISFTDR